MESGYGIYADTDQTNDNDCVRKCGGPQTKTQRLPPPGFTLSKPYPLFSDIQNTPGQLTSTYSARQLANPGRLLFVQACRFTVRRASSTHDRSFQS